MPIVPATLSDTDEIVALVNSAYRGKAAEAGWTHEAGMLDGQRTDAASVRDMLGNGRTTVLLLRDPAPTLAGCVAVEPAEGSTWYIGMLTIAPDRQADGLGRGLLAQGEAWAARHGASRVRITVIQLRATLIAWYERRGYRLTGKTEPFPYEDQRFGIPLRDDLHFVVLEKSLGAASD